ncbi:MAG: DUF2804 domain-containing protein [Spirochaetales bacterium]|jgi:hypothetical protein|nr:DUF2804 domain-containing protein [Spirochaetales bacterium]
MQHEVTNRQQLLTKEGKIQEEGWARLPLWSYQRKKIASNWLRIKEWDYYYIMLPEQQMFLTVTVSDLGYAGLMAVGLIDLQKQTAHQIDSLAPLTRGKLGLSSRSNQGLVNFSDKKMTITISAQEHSRHLSVTVPEFTGDAGILPLSADLIITQPEKAQSMNIATSWSENRKAFYLNEKTTCMSVQGILSLGSREISCSPKKDFAGLDWGRGRWTYKNRWYWSSLSSQINGHPFGFNLGYGFSDRTPASENALFYDQKIHKLENVDFVFDADDYMKPWKFNSSDNRLKLTFKPAVDRYSKTDLLVIKSVQHQVFGYFSGEAILDSGKKISIDKLPGFAEDVLNYW